MRKKTFHFISVKRQHKTYFVTSIFSFSTTVLLKFWNGHSVTNISWSKYMSVGMKVQFCRKTCNIQYTKSMAKKT